MRVLIADDDPAFRHLLEDILVKWGYDPVAARDGNEAWQVMQQADSPQIAILDWKMPGIEGVDICRRVRKERHEPFAYLILLTYQAREEDIAAGMEAGADDFILKPLKTNELRVRLDAAKRIVELQNELLIARRTMAEQGAELESAIGNLERFSSTVSTRLLIPLATISTQAQLLHDVLCRMDNQQCEAFAKKISDEAVQLTQLTHEVLDSLHRRGES
ncbi:MAG TPA: response regulator [Desulfuromonadaceae bacterium]